MLVSKKYNFVCFLWCNFALLRVLPIVYRLTSSRLFPSLWNRFHVCNHPRRIVSRARTWIVGECFRWQGFRQILASIPLFGLKALCQMDAEYVNDKSYKSRDSIGRVRWCLFSSPTLVWVCVTVSVHEYFHCLLALLSLLKTLCTLISLIFSALSMFKTAS